MSSTSSSGGSRCALCFDKRHQLARHVHFLQIGDESTLAGHLHEQYGDRAEENGQIGAIIAWVLSMRQTYGGKVDDDGRSLPVWEAWLLAQGAARWQVERFRPREAA